MYLSYLEKRFIPMLDADGGAGGGAAASDPGADPGAGASADPAKADDGKNGKKDPDFGEMLKGNPAFQAELDRRINQAVETATQKERDRQQIIQDNLQDEVLRVSKMTQQEKDAYFKQKAEKEAAEKEASLTKRELTLDARSALQDKHLPEAFLDLLVYTDKAACLKSIDTLDAAFREAVQAAVDEKLKGKEPPKDAKTEGTGAASPDTDQQKAIAEAMKIAGLRTK